MATLVCGLSSWQRITGRIALGLARRADRYLAVANKGLESALATQRQRNRELTDDYNGLVDRIEVLAALGVTPQSDDSWRFDFDALLPYMDEDSIADLRAALRRMEG